MKNRCDGCGSKIQFLNPQERGFIKREVYMKNPDNFLCERCYNIIHYNKRSDISIEKEEFKKQIDYIASKKAVVVNVVDIFDLEATIIKNINQMFKNNKIIIVANKYDLFPSSTKPTRILSRLKDYLKSMNVFCDRTLLVSSKNDEDIIFLLNKIYEVKEESNDIYLFGCSNVGKSSIVNRILNVVESKNAKATVSNMLATTLDLIKIPLPDGTFLYDTPGLINERQFIHYLDQSTINKLIPKKFIKPKVYQLKKEQTIFLGGFASISIIDNDCSLIAYISSEIPVHRTKTSNKNDFYKMHLDDILLVPTTAERKRLGSVMITHKFMIDSEKDISISGLGFVSIKTNFKVNVEVECFEKIDVFIRDTLI